MFATLLLSLSLASAAPAPASVESEKTITAHEAIAESLQSIKVQLAEDIKASILCNTRESMKDSLNSIKLPVEPATFSVPRLSE